MKDTLKSIFSPKFLITIGLLLGALLLLRVVSNAWEWALTKKELPLRQSLERIPERFGPFELAHDEKMSEEAEKALNTNRYISRVYRDTRKDDSDPGSAIRIHAAYYSGGQEPVSAIHVPEICYPSQGIKSVGVDQSKTEIPFENPEPAGEDDISVITHTGQKVRLPGKEIPFRQFTYIPGDKDSTESVVYFFMYNGKFVGSRNEIALHYLDRSSQYAYYCKIEVVPGFIRRGNDNEYGFRPGVEDKEETRQLAAEFLAHFIPELQLCLPDWQQVLEEEK
ncbi:MAG: exosortase-associated EpsI family protein [Verrucomicrobiota bacterium]